MNSTTLGYVLFGLGAVVLGITLFYKRPAFKWYVVLPLFLWGISLAAPQWVASWFYVPAIASGVILLPAALGIKWLTNVTIVLGVVLSLLAAFGILPGQIASQLQLTLGRF